MENYEEASTVEKDFHAIGVIPDDEPTKDSKGTCKRSQASMSKPKEKEWFDLEAWPVL